MPSPKNKTTNNNSNNDIDDLSPDTLALLERAKKRFIFSMSLLFIGIAAVIFAVVMRSSDNTQKDNTQDLVNKYTAGVLVVPNGAQILSTIPSEGMIAITFEVDKKTTLRLLDGATGAVIKDIDFVSER